jgi:hypothetical protein
MVIWRVRGTAQDRVHPADLVHGEVDQRPLVSAAGRLVTVASWRSGRLPAGPPPPLSRVAVIGPAAAGHAGRRVASSGDREPGAGAQGQSDVPVPGSVLSDLVVV